ncbi:hypothetical protein SF83666_b68120 (plasmid) [Sinorhizobium fredii CCBAU 83666]|nr:hypothetical protein SF83666_b68120 [Sinorhizobium fredii CCBAU 83666]
MAIASVGGEESTPRDGGIGYTTEEKMIEQNSAARPAGARPC